MAKWFRDGHSDYQDDLEWWRLVQEADRALLRSDNSQSGGDDECTLEGFPTDDDARVDDSTDNSQQEEAVRDEERTPIASLSQDYIDDRTSQRWTIRAFAVKGDPSLDNGQSNPWKLQAFAAGFHEFQVDIEHEVFQSETLTPLDALLAELSYLAMDAQRSQRQGEEVTYSEVLSGLRTRYARSSVLDPVELSSEAGQAFVSIGRSLTGQASTEDADVLFSDLRESERNAVIRRMATRNVQNYQHLISEGGFLEYAPRKTIVRFIEEHADLFFDGNYWDDAYMSIDYGHQTATEEARGQVLRHYLGLLNDALWLAEQEPDDLARESLSAVAQSVAGFGPTGSYGCGRGLEQIVSITQSFLAEERLLRGPWQAFERDVARLLLANGFDDVRIVGSPGDRGADVLGSINGELWTVQCKHTTMGTPPRAALSEVVEAGKYYAADRLVVATSRAPGDAFKDELVRYRRTGLNIQVADPNVLLNLMSNTPEYPPVRRRLRDYQEYAASRFREGLVDTGRAQIILATGLGKTVVMSEVVADLLNDDLIEGGRVLVLAHTNELVNQLHRTFWYQLPRWVSTHQLSEGEVPAYWDGITFATVQSAKSRADELPYFGLILVDEAHHIGARTFRDTIDELHPRMIGGVTATPWRGDQFDLDEVLGPPLVRIGIAEGLRRGFLSEVDYRLFADNIDWSIFKSRLRTVILLHS